MSTVELVAGMTVCLGVGGPGPCVGTIVRVDGDGVDGGRAGGTTVDIDLDAGRPPGRRGEDITLFATDADGLHSWPTRRLEGGDPSGPGPAPDRTTGATADGAAPRPDRVRLATTGPVSVVQRRRHPRVAVDLRGEVTLMRQGRRRPRRPITVTDLSHGGARFSGPVRLEVGDTVMLHIDPGGGVLDLRGRVAMAYDDPAGRRVGHVAFLAPEEPTAELRRLDRYLVPQMAGAGRPPGSRAAGWPRAW